MIGAYGRAENARGGTIPADLEPAVKQMKDAFSYQAFTLLDTIAVRGTEGTGMVLKGLLPSTATPINLAYFYETGYRTERTSDADKTMEFLNFRFNIRVPVTGGPNLTYGDTGIGTSVTIREGQQLVLGKLKIDQSADNAVFLVLTSKVE